MYRDDNSQTPPASEEAKKKPSLVCIMCEAKDDAVKELIEKVAAQESEIMALKETVAFLKFAPTM